MTFLTRETYFAEVRKLTQGGTSHWRSKRNSRKRWDYVRRTVSLIEAIGVRDPKAVLELGSMGVRCVKDSVTMDYAVGWDISYGPDVTHDAKSFPWPFDDQQFDIFVALRVFQHLAPLQKECLHEAFRVARHVIIVTDPDYGRRTSERSQGISYRDYVRFMDGVHPQLYFPTALGELYYWDKAQPSMLDIEHVCAPHKRLNHAEKTSA